MHCCGRGSTLSATGCAAVSSNKNSFSTYLSHRFRKKSAPSNCRQTCGRKLFRKSTGTPPDDRICQDGERGEDVCPLSFLVCRSAPNSDLSCTVRYMQFLLPSHRTPLILGPKASSIFLKALSISDAYLLCGYDIVHLAAENAVEASQLLTGAFSLQLQSCP